MANTMVEMKSFFANSADWARIRGYAIRRRQQALEELCDLEVDPEMTRRLRIVAAVWKEVIDLPELFIQEEDNLEVLSAIAEMDEVELAEYLSREMENPHG